MSKLEENKIIEIKETIKSNIALDLNNNDLNLLHKRIKFFDDQANTIRDSLEEGILLDYAKIPGCGSKPSLLLPGARKIAMTFGITTQFDIVEKEVSENTLKVRYVVKATCLINGNIISESFGGANNLESKSANMNENSILKIAQKRAFIGAILQVSNLSKLFTQDVEDMEPKTKNFVAKKEVDETTKKERFAFYGLVQKKYKLRQDETKLKVREIIGKYNDSNNTTYKTILEFSEIDFKNIKRKYGEDDE